MGEKLIASHYIAYTIDYIFLMTQKWVKILKKSKNKFHYILDSFRLSELVLKLDKAVAFELKTEQINIYIGNRWICCLY